MGREIVVSVENLFSLLADEEGGKGEGGKEDIFSPMSQRELQQRLLPYLHRSMSLGNLQVKVHEVHENDILPSESREPTPPSPGMGEPSSRLTAIREFLHKKPPFPHNPPLLTTSLQPVEEPPGGAGGLLPLGESDPVAGEALVEGGPPSEPPPSTPPLKAETDLLLLLAGGLYQADPDL